MSIQSKRAASGSQCCHLDACTHIRARQTSCMQLKSQACVFLQQCQACKCLQQHGAECKAELAPPGDCHRALAAKPTAACYGNRALAYLKSGDAGAAEADAGAALRMDAAFLKAWQRRAAARRALGRPLSAVADLEEALRCASACLRSNHVGCQLRVMRTVLKRLHATNMGEALRGARSQHTTALLHAACPGGGSRQ